MNLICEHHGCDFSWTKNDYSNYRDNILGGNSKNSWPLGLMDKIRYLNTQKIRDVIDELKKAKYFDSKWMIFRKFIKKI